ELRVTELSAAVLGTTVGLKEPVVARGLADLQALFAAAAPPAGTQPSTAQASPTRPAGDPTKAHLSGAVTLAGQLEPLLILQAVLGGQPARAEYAGAFAVDQKVGTNAGAITLVGGGTVTDFVARDAAGKPTLTEKTVRLVDDLSLDTRGVGTLTVGRLGLAFEGSGALDVQANAKLSDLARGRKIDYVLANVGYDAEKLWPILHGMMADPTVPPEKDPYKGYVIKGKGSRSFTVGGSYPAVDAAGRPVPFNVAIQSLAIRGSIGLDSIEAEGLGIGRAAPNAATLPAMAAGPAANGGAAANAPIEIPVSLRDGRLHLADLSKPEGQQTPAPIACNGGSINPYGVVVNLTGAVNTLSAPPGLPLLDKVQLNPVLADALGQYFNHPLLVGADTAKGVLDLKMLECRDVPLGKAAKLRTPDNKGYAVVEMSFGGIQLGNPALAGVLAAVKVNTNSLQGEIKQAKITYDRGIIGHDTTFALAERGRTLRLYGNVNLATEQMAPMALLVSSEWFGGDVAKYVQKGLPLTFTGSYRHPQYNFGAAFQEAVKQNVASPEGIGGLIDQFTNKNKKKDKDGGKPDGTKSDAAQPGATPSPADGTPATGGNEAVAATRPAAKPNDPASLLGGLLDQAMKDREEKAKRDKEKKERERKRKQDQNADR
ncbi:MAG: hypothetical protein JWO31_1067, partial [Phycisphaerales bacterium]|nr:hypothetical protein [Phycisphaerales bacterium]